MATSYSANNALDRTPEDISAANLNGQRSVGVLWAFSDLAELQVAGTEVILRSTNELRQFGAQQMFGADARKTPRGTNIAIDPHE